MVACIPNNDDKDVACNIVNAPLPTTVYSNEFSQIDEVQNKVINSIVIREPYAYVGANSFFAILDISDPKEPQLLSSIPIPVDSIDILGDYAFLKGYESFIFDISDPKIPFEVICKNNPSFTFSNGTASDDYAYIPLGGDGLQILDVSNPTSLLEASVYQPTIPPQIHFEPGFEYIQSQPKLITHVTVLNDYAFVVENLLGIDSYYDGVISILDISNPEKPEIVNTYEMPNNAGVGNLILNDDYLVATTSYLDPPLGVILDISNPQNQITEVARNLPPGLFAFNNPYGIVAQGSTGLELWDFSSPTTPVSYPLEELNYSYVREVAISGNYAYFATLFGVMIVDISNPAEPETITVIFD